MDLKVKEAAERVGVSVRTLHHYDQIGLLKPSHCTRSGYRIYTVADFERLQQILFFRETGFSLKETGRILEHPEYDRTEALLAQKRILQQKRERLTDLIRTIDRALENSVEQTETGGKNMFESFSMEEIEKHRKKYAEEAEKKYGTTPAWQESSKRTAGYTKEKWEKIMSDAAILYRNLAGIMDEPVSSEVVQNEIDAWRRHISEYYYECTPEIFRNLGDLYISDERFTRNIDKYGEGLAAFMNNAITWYCDHL